MFTGKCSKCEVMKADFEEPPTPYDLLLCNMCYNQVTKDSLRDNTVLSIIEELEGLYTTSRRFSLQEAKNLSFYHHVHCKSVYKELGFVLEQMRTLLAN